MNRIDRLQAIITQLQSKKVVKASEIAERFGISLRTVYRDVRALEEAGVPIGAEAGVGYYLADGYHLPPISFTEEEASSLIISHQLVEKWGDNSLYKQHSDAVYKIKSVLKPEQKDTIEKLEQRILTSWHFPMPKKQPSLHFDKIQSALVNNNLMSVKYFSSYRQEFSERTIEPIGICFFLNYWPLIGYCYFRKDYRYSTEI
jgi:predicted DNA-binding transcriptional regulator YafY